MTMKIVKETAEAFDTVEAKGRGAKAPQRIAVEALGINEVIRFVDHPHRTSSTSPSCGFHVNLVENMKILDRKISIRHDGKDLLVKRVK